MQNNCDGSGPHASGEVRLLPTGGDGNLILCQKCFEYELSWRRERNRGLAPFAQFSLPTWESAKIYTT